MKGLLLIAGVLALAGLPVQAGTHISISIGGAGYHGFSCGNVSRCGYNWGCYPYRSGYYGYYGYPYGGYSYAGYSPYYYSGGYDAVSYLPTSVPPPPSAPPQNYAPAAQPDSTTPAPSPATPPAPPPAPMEFGILDVNGYVHSPYSDALLKIPNVRTAQMVYDPVTGKPFLVR